MMQYLGEDQEVQVIRRSTGAETVTLEPIISGMELLEFQQAVRAVTLPPALGEYTVELVTASRPSQPGCPDFVKEYIAWGAGLRASQNIALAAKSVAAQDGRDTATLDDVRRVIVPVLRHRIGLSFRADVDRVTVEDIVARLVKHTREP
jgi:MoxR-like ATPase